MRPKRAGVRLVAAQAIAPRAGRLDIIVVLGEAEGGAFELLGDRGEAVEQRLAAGDDERRYGRAAPAPGRRQMKLAPADIDPHVGVGHHQIGVAGQPEPRDIEQCRQPLVGDLNVDVLEMDRVAEVLGGAVEIVLLHGCGSRGGRTRHDPTAGP